MSKDEKRIYFWGYLIGLVIAVACVVVVVGEFVQKKGAYADENEEFDYFIETTEETSETGEFSLMPCVAPSEFKAWYETYGGDDESSAEEEGGPDEIRDEDERGSETSEETDDMYRSEESSLEMSTEVETTVDAEEKAWVETSVDDNETGPVVWYVNGKQIDQGITDLLTDALERHGIGHWIEGALAQIYQESHAQQYAVSDDGRDYGILQYRAEYWGGVCAQYGYDGADIYDMYVQFDIYATQMANRFNQGMSVPDAISRHMTSDYGGFDAKYYGDVIRWLPTVERK